MTNNTPLLKRPAFHAWLVPEDADPDPADDQLIYRHIVVNHSDQLRAELEGVKHKVDPRHHPMHLTSLWLWAALVRTGDYTKTFHEFKTDLVAYDQDRDRPSPHTDDAADQERDELDARPTEAKSS